MTSHWTRYPDEEERIKNVYEALDDALTALTEFVPAGTSAAERHEETFVDLVKRLTGLTDDEHLSYDPDKATVARNAARQWLRAREGRS